MWKVTRTVTEELTPIAGYNKPTVFRAPKKGEFYYYDGLVFTAGSDFAIKYWIIEPTYQLPSWLRAGWWLYYHGYDGSWFVADKSPQISGCGLKYHGNFAVAIRAEDAAAMFGEVFVAPNNTSDFYQKG